MKEVRVGRTFSWLNAICLCVSLLSACHVGEKSYDIGLYMPPDGAEQIKQVARECSRLSHGVYTIVVHSLPRNANDQRLQLARRLIGGDSSLDLMGMDVIWTAEFADAGWVFPIPDNYAENVHKQVLSGPYTTAIWKNKLYGFPLWANTQLLWYRKDLVERYLHGRVPQNWDELVSAASTLNDIHVPSWIGASGRQNEGLLVWFNSLLVSAGGQLISDDGQRVTLTDTFEHNHATEEAIRIIHSVATYVGQDPSFIESDEAHSRLSMENGSAAFEINWPYVFASMRNNSVAGAVPFLSEVKGKPFESIEDKERLNNIIRKKFDFAPFPSVPGGQSFATLGGINLGIAKTSHKPTLALMAAECLSKPEHQVLYATSAGVPPTAKQLYSEPMIQAVFPAWKIIYQQLSKAAVRPKTSRYQTISTLLTARLSPVTQLPPSPSEIEKAVRKAIEGKGLVP